MSFKLSDLLIYNDIVVQCHDNPDADALASGFALYWYFKNNDKKVRLVYGGTFPLKKSNLVLMRDTLGIPAEHVTYLEKPELLINVDCQHGESNTTNFEADNIAVIDHHQVSGTLPKLSEIRSNYGSCSTLINEMLEAEGIDINTDINIATALYYGLMTDTSSFAEISHPADKDLRDKARPNKGNIILFKNSNISRDDLRIAGDALKSAVYNDDKRYVIVEAEPCDPNILGLISDMVLEVDSILTSLVYSMLSYGVKISIRSCVKEVKASELAAYIADSYGGGGGHLVKAGGFMKKDLLEKDGYEFCKKTIRELLTNRMDEYFTNTEIIYAGTKPTSLEGFEQYVKKDVAVGYVRASEFVTDKTDVTIRTLEGDIDTTIDEDTIIIIGIDGGIYPIESEIFKSGYQVTDDGYKFPGEYSPVLVNIASGERIDILAKAKKCIERGGASIWAKRLDHRVKVFTLKNSDKYNLGIPGDYLVVQENDSTDISIIEQNIFNKFY